MHFTTNYFGFNCKQKLIRNYYFLFLAIHSLVLALLIYALLRWEDICLKCPPYICSFGQIRKYMTTVALGSNYWLYNIYWMDPSFMQICLIIWTSRIKCLVYFIICYPESERNKWRLISKASTSIVARNIFWNIDKVFLSWENQ